MGRGYDWKMAIVKNVDAKRTSLESKLIVPDADIENLTVLSRDNISSVNFGAFEPMFERYNAKKAYILFFSQNLIENKILVDVIAINRVQRKQFKLSFVNANSGQYAAVMERVAAKTVEYLASMQKSEQQAGSTLIKIQVNFGSLEKWLELKNKISSVNFGAFEPMFERYNAKKAYILFFSQNLIENKILVDVIAVS